MRKLATIALLASSLLFTVACTEQDETELDLAAAEADEPTDLVMGDGADVVSQRDRGPGGEPAADRLDAPATSRPAHAPSAEPAADRLGQGGAPADRLGGQPGTGVIDCRIDSRFGADEPVIDTVSDEVSSDEAGRRARARLDLLRQAKLERFRAQPRLDRGPRKLDRFD